MPRLLLLLLLAALAALPRPAVGQGVLVAPHAIYLDHRTRSASITLYNPGAEPTEVAISAFYAYPVTDSLGQFTLETPESVTSAMPSAADWIEAFPKRMTLAPLQRQTVRLLARPPQNLPDGEYWSRVMIAAKGGSLPVASAADTTGIEIGLSLEVRTIIPLTYRKGVLQTGLALSNLRARVEGDSLQVRIRARRQGSAAYVGTARGALVDARGNAVATFSEPVAIYYEADPSFALPRVGLPAGRYQLQVEFASERPDLLPEQLLRIPPVRDSLEVELP
jgi:hypothetical protein